MNSNDIRHALETTPENLHEIQEERTFTAQRAISGGGEEKVTFRFYDYGEGFTAGRYACVATTEDGRMASGNPADDMLTVLMTLHWNDLDRDQDE